MLGGIGEDRSLNVRSSVLAGSWYSAKKSQLDKTITELLAGAEHRRRDGRILALIVPHAGYQYSGKCAAAGYAAVRDADTRRVVILGTPHHAYIRGASIPMVSAYRTPLGDVPLDRDACDALLAGDLFTTDHRAHAQEHSIEIQLPFLQKVLPKAAIVPILVGEIVAGQWKRFADALRGVVDERTLVVVSTDFTHYGPRFGYTPFRDSIPANLEKLDGGAFDRIKAIDPDGFLDYKRKTGATICGANAVAALLHMMKGRADATLLQYDRSGDVVGDYSDCVSYGTFLFTERKAQAVRAGLAPDEKNTLISIARTSLERWVRQQKKTDPLKEDFDVTDALREKRGAFVTLRKGGRLRGCIGYIEGRRPLAVAVAENAVNAGSRDFRFPQPVQPDELSDITIEVSALTPLREIDDPENVEVGRHGVYIVKGGYSGLLLPQVAPEQGWDRNQLLVGVCRKAGLPPTAYKDPDSVLYVFEAEVFGEEDAH